MQPLAFYLLKVIACSGILLLYYRIALRNKRFHYYNRFYLLATIAASTLLPLLNINWFTINSSNDKAIALMNVMYVQNGEAPTGSNGSFFTVNWQQAPVLIYSLVSILFIIILLWRVRKIYSFKKKYSATSMGEFDFINTDLSQAPFSFLQNLFWRSDIDLSETTGRQILQHELTHIRQKHTWDKLCMQLVLSLFWINPFYWFIQKELYLLHEFIADEKAIENNDGAAFAAMLLTSQYGKNIFSPAQPFAYSPIKRRLFMLTNIAKPRYSYARRLMVLPLLAAVVLLFAFRVQKKNEITVQDVFIATPATPLFKVVVDAGHGGGDGGLQLNGASEKDIVLHLAKKIKEFSAKYNIDVVLTRSDNTAISEQERLAFAASQNAGAFISLHIDYSNNPSQTGFRAFVSAANTHFFESRLLGSAVLHSLSGSFKVNDTLKQREKTVAVLNNNPLPAIVVECGAMNNTTDFKNVTAEATIATIAEDILQGIARYANHNSSETSDVHQPFVAGLYMPVDTTPAVTLTNKGVTITVKGTGGLCTIDSANPVTQALVVLDGKEMPAANLNSIQVTDIGSVYILKGHDAVDKYGAKGNNGAIEIYTKGNEHAKTTYIKDVTLTEVPGIKLDGVQPRKPGMVTQATGQLTYRADSITITSSEPIKENGGPVITIAAGVQPATFPGGAVAWKAYLERQLKADIAAEKGAPAGTYTVMVSFIVDEEGNIKNAEAVNNPGYGTAEEAVRIIQRGPKWLPAKQNGTAVTVIQKQNISFKAGK